MRIADTSHRLPLPSSAPSRAVLPLGVLVLGLAAMVRADGLAASAVRAGARAPSEVSASSEAVPAGSYGPMQASPSPSPSPTYEPWVPIGTWRVVHSAGVDPLWRGDQPTLRGVHLVPDGEGGIVGWAVGLNGAMARYDGASWRSVDDFNPRSTMPRTYHFHDVFVKAADDAWVVGKVDGDKTCDGCGTVLHYDGRTWVELDRYDYRINGRMGALNAIDMLQDANGDWHGWAVGDDADFDVFKAMILRYTPDGNWRLWRSHNIAKHLYAVRLVSPTEAWAVGQDGVESRYNEDGGAGLWPPLGRSGADTLYAVDLTDPLSGWDGGFRGRMNKYRGHCHDDDPNTTCWFQNEHIPVRTESGSLWNVTIYAIDLIDRNQGWLVGAASGRVSTIAYHSSENRWTLVSVPGDPGKTLRGLQMIDANLGWAVGEGGVLLQYRAEVPPTAAASSTPTATPSIAASATASATASPTSSAGTLEATATATEAPPSPSSTSATPVETPTSDIEPPPTPADPTSVAPPSVTASRTPDGSHGIRLYVPLASRRR